MGSLASWAACPEQDFNLSCNLGALAMGRKLMQRIFHYDVCDGDIQDENYKAMIHTPTLSRYSQGQNANIFPHSNDLSYAT